MVVTIDSKFYSKLQLGISKYQEKTPADPLKVMSYEIMQYSLGIFVAVLRNSRKDQVVSHGEIFKFANSKFGF